MNTYASEDLNNLIDSILKDKEFEDIYGDLFTSIIINGNKRPIKCDTIVKIVFNDIRLQGLCEENPNSHKLLYLHIHYTPFEQVPLLINSFPEIAI